MAAEELLSEITAGMKTPIFSESVCVWGGGGGGGGEKGEMVGKASGSRGVAV